MSLLNTLKFILNHPVNKGNKKKALLRFLKWQINNRLNPYPVIFKFVEKSRFIAWKGMTGATGNMYCGLHEFEDMMFVLHFLRNSDIFIDIGANVGSYTLLAAKEKEAETISIEPIPSTFEYLEDNLRLNRIEKLVTALNIGLGSKKSVIKFTKTLDTVNHVALDDELNTIDIPVERFDNIIHLDKYALIKIDVEGFETEVLKGMSKGLSNENLKAIIIELNGSGGRYGYDESNIHNFLIANDFLPYRYSPFDRKLIQMETYGSHNTIYIRDIDLVTERVATERKFKILDVEV